MHSNFLQLFQTTCQKGFPILLSLLDDALLLGLSRIGISLPWLQWLSLILLSATLAYWAWRILHFLYVKFTLNSVYTGQDL